MVNFADASVYDLVRATKFLHHIRPSFSDKLVYSIEKYKPMDKNVVFHLIERNVEEDEKRSSEEDSEIFLLSAEYILQHPYWQGQK